MNKNLRLTLQLCAVNLMVAGSAHAACTVTLSSATLDMGRGLTSSMSPSEVPGYRQMGVRSVSVNGQCDAPQTGIRLRFTGLQSLPGKSLVEWGKDGALAFVIERASVDGVQVPMAVAMSASAGPSPLNAVTLVQDSTVELDLSRLPAAARKSFSLQLKLTGLVAQGFVARSETKLNKDFFVQLLPSS